MTAAVTVIMTCLNSERFVAEAIESVVSQTFSDWRLVVVDDGSTDGTPAILERCADRLGDRIVVVTHPGRANLGMSASRNRALDEADGAYVAFLDSDDVWLPTKLESDVGLLGTLPQAAMVFGRAESWYSWTGEAADAGRDSISEFAFEVDRLWSPPHLLPQILRAERPTTTVGLVRRRIVSHVGGFENGFHGLYEDQAFFAKVSLEFPIYVSGSSSYRWRQHDRSSCATEVRAGTYARSRAAFLAWLRSYLIARGVDHAEIWSELQRQERALDRGISGSARRFGVASIAHGRRHAARILSPRALAAARRIESGITRRRSSGATRHVQLGDLARTAPISRAYGSDRGTPIDRYYIDRFLGDHTEDVHGRVLEVKDDRYTRRMGAGRVLRSDVVDILSSNPSATVVADLVAGEGLDDETYDCMILTQTLQMVYDLEAACATLHRVLAPGGVALVTVPGITSLADREWRASWYWNFTTHGLRRLLETAFPPAAVDVRAYGNVLTATGFLHGLAAEELPPDAFTVDDSDYELVVVGRAVKDAAPAPA